MVAALRHIRAHPGCTKGQAATAACPRSRRAGYAAVDRCLLHGLATATPAGRGYQMHLTDLGGRVLDHTEGR